MNSLSKLSAGKKAAEKEARLLRLELDRHRQKKDQAQAALAKSTQAAVTIQRFYRKKKRTLMQRKALLAEYVRPRQRFIRSQEENQTMLRQVAANTGVFMIRNHFQSVSSMLTTICRDFLAGD